MGWHLNCSLVVMFRRFALLFFVCCASLAFGGLDLERLKRIDVLMEGWIEAGKFPGGAVLISEGDEVVKFSCYGAVDGGDKPVTEQTLYRFFSMTKPVTVAAALILYERGEFLLDDPINLHWPEMSKLRVYKGVEDGEMLTAVPDAYPTVMDLMMHTAGFYYAYSDHPAHQKLKSIDIPQSGASISEVALLIADSPLLFEPGERWNYGYSQHVLAGFVEHVAQEPYGDFVQREILGPLGMQDTGYYLEPSDADRLMGVFKLGEDGKYTDYPETLSWLDSERVTWGGTGLVGSAKDYWKFTQMLLRGGEFNSARILSKASVEFMLSNRFPSEKLPYEAPGSPYERFAKGYGFGLGVKVMVDPTEAGNLTSIGEAGWSGAASTYFWVIPEHDLVVMFLTQNRSYLEIQPLSEYVKAAVYQSLD